ncbi:putative reverse transcriptase domain-containing protein [Tanacetum coccineum]
MKSSKTTMVPPQLPSRGQNSAKSRIMGTGERKPYGGSLPKFRNANVANTQKGNGANPKGNGCFECGAPRHFKKDCPMLKNKDGGNGSAQVCSVGNATKKGMHRGPDSNVVTGSVHAGIECDEKLVRVPYGNETLTFHATRQRRTSPEGKQLKDYHSSNIFLEVLPDDLPSSSSSPWNSE